MPTPIHLTVPEPCHENWQNMSAGEQGRHCLACQRTVVDFSVMSDREILAYMSRSGNQVCGRFDNRQLNKTYSDKNSKKPFSWRSAWSMAVAAILITSNAVMGQSKAALKKKAYKYKKFRGLKSVIKWDSKETLFKVEGWQSITLGFVVNTHEQKEWLPEIDYLNPMKINVGSAPGYSAAKTGTPEKPADDIPRAQLPDVTVEELVAVQRSSLNERIIREVEG